MVCKNGGMMIDLLNGVIESIDIDTETTDMRYSSIEWCTKMVEPMTDLLNGV